MKLFVLDRVGCCGWEVVCFYLFVCLFVYLFVFVEGSLGVIREGGRRVSGTCLCVPISKSQPKYAQLLGRGEEIVYIFKIA